jgi:hypothetical protein
LKATPGKVKLVITNTKADCNNSNLALPNSYGRQAVNGRSFDKEELPFVFIKALLFVDKWELVVKSTSLAFNSI